MVVGNVVTVLPVTLLHTLAMWLRCFRSRFFIRWQCGYGASGHVSSYVGNLVTVLPVTLLDTLAMWLRCFRSRFLIRWQCGDGASGHAS